jgi:hypothetical protein
MSKRQNIVIGLGSGRCGTKSLANILGIPHEAHPLPWQYNDRLFRRALDMVRLSGGDVGCYWLNYVDRVLAIHPHTKFVCLKRSRDQTVRSWCRRFLGSERFCLFVFHLDPNDRVRALNMFGDYGHASIEEAAGLYWDEYYRRAEILQEMYPESFRIFWMDRVMKDKRKQKQLVKFAGLRWKSHAETHENAGGIHDPEFGNVLREAVGWLVLNDRVYAKTKATIAPEPGSKLGELAVKSGISESPTDPIVIDFDRLTQRCKQGWIYE